MYVPIIENSEILKKKRNYIKSIYFDIKPFHIIHFETVLIGLYRALTL